MRQLVSVVKDGHVNYILAEDDGTVDQIARIKVPESFSIEDTVTLGFGLVDAMHLNGTKRNGATREPAIEKPAPASLPPAPKAKAGRPVGTTSRKWGAGREPILAALRATTEPLTYKELTQRVTGSTEKGAVQSVMATLADLRKRGYRFETTPVEIVYSSGGVGRGVALRLVESPTD